MSYDDRSNALAVTIEYSALYKPVKRWQYSGLHHLVEHYLFKKKKIAATQKTQALGSV
jgi:hypothetical protein